jgi:cytidylate kinase
MKITINGLSCSGKGTIAKTFAKYYGFEYLDLGLIFRLTAYASKVMNLKSIPKETTAIFKDKKVSYLWENGQAKATLSGIDVTDKLFNQEIAALTALVSSQAENIHAMLEVCRVLSEDKVDLICDGRNAAYLFPNAEAKFYLEASLEVRARRRQLDFARRGTVKTYEQVYADLSERDTCDTTRKHLPSVVPEDAHIILTDALSIEECIAQMVSVLRRINFNP